MTHQHNPKTHLPYGVALRDLLQHPSLTGPSLKYLLQTRGVFTGNNNDDINIPFLITTLLSPEEFEFIRERVKVKEEKEKVNTTTLEWHSEKNLFECLPQIDVKNIISEIYPKYNVKNIKPFIPLDGNKDIVRLDFECDSFNYNTSWYRTRNEFSGSITLEKVVEKGKVNVIVKYTSSETNQIANKIVNSVESHFKENKYTSPKERERILFRSFTNEERIRFFLALTDDDTMFQFNRIVNIDIAPDPMHTLPKDFVWLEESKVKQLKINGDQIHKIPFIRDKVNHKYMEIAGMDVIYNFSTHYAEGTCRVRCEFEGYFKKRIPSIEFSTYVENINLKEEYKHLKIEKIRVKLQEEFEKKKLETFDWFKLQHLRSEYTPIPN